MSEAIPAPMRLRVEHLREALGIDASRPRLSWQPAEASGAQLAYEIEAITASGTWRSGVVASAASVLVPYEGPAPGSRERVSWRVRVHTDAGISAWSEPAFWECGLLAPGDWSARWIRPYEPELLPAGSRPTHRLGTTFRVDRPVTRARLYATAHGVYEAQLGGVRVGDLELTPGYTQYEHRLQVQTYDVTELVGPGESSLSFELSDGWFRGKIGIFRATEQWGERTALLAQLELEHADGSRTVVASDETWLSRQTLHLADPIDGETVDLNDPARAAAVPEAGGDGWAPVELADPATAQLVASPAPPVRRTETRTPIGITTVGDATVVDFGQNINGWVRLERLGPAGSRLTLTYGEELGPDGDVTRVNLEPDIPMTGGRLPAGQVDHVVSDGSPRAVFEPRHTTRGFRFVRIEGLTDRLDDAGIRAVVVHTDLERTGTFACSDDRINRLHDAAVWSFRGNACDIPTDCPVRERAGWTGDWQVFLPTAAYLFDVAGFSTKWLRDLAVAQWSNGIVANTAPAPRAEGEGTPVGFMNGSAGWGDACVFVPWQLYCSYGDVDVLRELWPTMVRWLDFARSKAESARHPERERMHPLPRPHDRFLWDTGFHFGEWLEPGEFDFGAHMAADKGVVATAFLRRSSWIMAQIAGVLGLDAESARYAEYSENVRAAWVTEFLADGAARPASQANCVRALAFELVPADARPGVAAQLAALVEAASDHLGTGFLATADLLPVLADAGYGELAYRVLFQDTAPSWLAMIDAGATTMWERWEGWSDDGQPYESHNHYSKGAVIAFLHRHMAGLRPSAGAVAWDRFEVRPLPGGGITWAEATFSSPRGRIATRWDIRDGVFTLVVTVPAGTTCVATLPSGATAELGAGAHTLVDA